ncbi:MAG TPA: type II secretion system protein [Candidatus Moranbacteria bacterium]|nr:type II secretion system protein [Candidatus Moranbacteria bacterium]
MKNIFFTTKKKGISIIEVLMVIAIISILAGTSASGYFYFKKGSDLSISEAQVANAIRKTQSRAKAMANDDAWGIDISESRALIFKGTNFSGRTQSYDINIPLRGLSGVSGKTQIIFYKLTGLPYATSIGTLVLDNGTNTKNIQINAEGIVSY